jgi:hypothetical protein
MCNLTKAIWSAETCRRFRTGKSRNAGTSPKARSCPRTKTRPRSTHYQSTYSVRHKCQSIPTLAAGVPQALNWLLDVGCSDLRPPSLPKIPVAFTGFFDSLLGLSGQAGRETVCSPRVGGAVLRSRCCEGGDHKNIENNPVFRGML